MRFSLVLFTAFLISCGPGYHTSRITNDAQNGYAATLLEPKDEPAGLFVYLSDSIQSDDLPTPLMEHYLDRNYQVLIPEKWGTDGREKAVLDNYENRVQGVSYTLEMAYFGTPVGQTGHFAIYSDALYSPVAMQIAENFRAEKIFLLNPMPYGLNRYFTEDLNAYKTAERPTVFKTFGIENDSLFEQLMIDIESEHPLNRRYGPAHSNFIHSYWDFPIIIDWIRRADQADWQIIINPNLSFYTPRTEAYWKYRFDDHTQVDTANYGAQTRVKMEELWIQP